MAIDSFCLKRFFKRFIMLIVLWPFALVSTADRVRYALTDVSWEPYWIMDGSEASGILHDITLELDKRLSVQLVPSKLMSVKRSKKAFNEGIIEIECCVNIAWRKDNAEASLWSDTILVVEEILVFPLGKSFKYENINDLKDRKISTIRGYGYVGDHLFKRSDSVSNISQIRKLALARAEAGIIDRAELSYIKKHISELAEQWHAIELGPVINRSELKVRIHHSREDLLKPINLAINDMKQKGIIKKTVNRYLY